MEEKVLPSTREREALDVFVKRLYAHCGDCVRSVVLFGSKARNDSGPDSDMDVLVVLKNDDPRLRSRVRRIAARISLDYGLLLSVHVVGRSQWNKLSRYRFAFYKAIESEGIDLTPQLA